MALPPQGSQFFARSMQGAAEGTAKQEKHFICLFYAKLLKVGFNTHANLCQRNGNKQIYELKQKYATAVKCLNCGNLSFCQVILTDEK